MFINVAIENHRVVKILLVLLSDAIFPQTLNLIQNEQAGEALHLWRCIRDSM